MSTNRLQGVESAKILSRTVRPRLFNLSPELARFILEMKLDDQDVVRLDELGAKNQDGTISADERHELEIYLQAGLLRGPDASKSLGFAQKGWPA